MKQQIMEKLLERLPEIENRKEILENAPLFLYRNSFTAIVAVLEARDGYTAHHSERVSLMIERYCKIMRMPVIQKESIGMMAAVHDVGKVGIPDAVLNKAGRLDNDEWALMCQHPVIGAEILLKAGRLRHIAEGVLYHHERWNGSGYPDGLQELEIPIGSRLLAICDSVDAMLTDRIYRKALPEEICKEELYKCKGELYDPKLTENFLRHWDKIIKGLY